MRKAALALLGSVLVLGGGLFVVGAGVFAADGGPATKPAVWPLWDGQETVEQYARRVNLPAAKTLDLGNGVNLDLVLIPAGKFVMGTTNRPKSTEGPAHEVTLTPPFYLGKDAVTQKQFEHITGKNPSYYKTMDPRDKETTDFRNHPVECVSWADAQEFCKRLGDSRKVAVRLPTEAEWEYACRAGTTAKYYAGDSEEDLKRVAWYSGNSVPAHPTHAVGQKEANKFGLYDMHGNVWQWCQDWYGAYTADAVKDPPGPPQPAQDARRVVRGGSWSTSATGCRSAYRTGNSPERRDDVRFLGPPAEREPDGRFRVGADGPKDIRLVLVAKAGGFRRDGDPL